MPSSKADDQSPRNGRQKRWITGVVTAVVVAAAAVALVVIVTSSTGRSGGGSSSGSSTANYQNSGSAIAPTSGPGEVLPPASGAAAAPAAATGSPVASDPAQPDFLPAVALNATAIPVTGLAVTVTNVSAVDGVGNGIGEVSGPALQFTVTALNNTGAAISLANTVVGASYSPALIPANELTSASTSLPLEVAAGETASGTYVFTIPADQRKAVQISVDYSAGVPVVVFAGTTP